MIYPAYKKLRFILFILCCLFITVLLYDYCASLPYFPNLTSRYAEFLVFDLAPSLDKAVADPTPPSVTLASSKSNIEYERPSPYLGGIVAAARTSDDISWIKELENE